MNDLIRIFIDTNWNINIVLNTWISLVPVVIIGLWILYKIFRDSSLGSKYYEIDEAIIGIGNQKIKIKPNYKDIQIAYKLWVELSTRKIGLPIDTENDVIIEMYKSWYEFFKLTRELIKEIPISKARKSKSTQNIIRIATEVLNKILRPHLTKWQAKFGKWYKFELNKEESIELSPQQIQHKFPQHDSLVEEMQEVNRRLIEYIRMLKDIAIGYDR